MPALAQMHHIEWFLLGAMASLRCEQSSFWILACSDCTKLWFMWRKLYLKHHFISPKLLRPLTLPWPNWQTKVWRHLQTCKSFQLLLPTALLMWQTDLWWKPDSCPSACLSVQTSENNLTFTGSLLPLQLFQGGNALEYNKKEALPLLFGKKGYIQMCCASSPSCSFVKGEKCRKGEWLLFQSPLKSAVLGDYNGLFGWA